MMTSNLKRIYDNQLNLGDFEVEKPSQPKAYIAHLSCMRGQQV